MNIPEWIIIGQLTVIAIIITRIYLEMPRAPNTPPR